MISKVDVQLSESRETSNGAMARLKQIAPILVVVLLFAGGAYALYHLLAPLDLKQVLNQIRATPIKTLVLACGATALGYIALIGYDWSAMQYLGKKVPLPNIALGGFLGYAFGNTIGLSAVSGGAVRYRIYSPEGLDGYDVAAVSSFAAISYGVGATVLGLAALAIHPLALQGMLTQSPATIRFFALAGLAIVLGGLIFIGTRKTPLKLWSLRIKPPTLADLGRQVIFTLGDILMGAFALYVLLPADGLSFSTFIAVFTVATMAGVISHVPGGIGVFESVVIAALPSGVALEQAVTGLLLFRLIYFLLPFFVALAVLALFEARSIISKDARVATPLSPILHAARDIVPTALAFLVMFSGLFLMAAGFFPDPVDLGEDIEILLPLAILQGGPLVSSLLGTALVIIAFAIYRRIRVAYWLLIGALGIGAVAAFIYGRDLDRMIYLTVLLILIAPFIGAFYRRARLPQLAQSPRQIGFTVVVFVIVGLLIGQALRVPVHGQQVWWLLGFTPDHFDALGLVLSLAIFFGFGALILSLQSRRIGSTPVDALSLQRAHTVINRFGHGGDMLALSGDKQFMFAADDLAVLAYSIRGTSWIALGAPVGEAEEVEDLTWGFIEAAKRAGGRAVFYEAPATFLPVVAATGMTAFKMGEEAVVDLDAFSLDGSSRKKLRTVYNRALRDGLRIERIAPPFNDELLVTLQNISDNWLSRGTRGKGEEKCFSIGRFSRDYIQRFPLVLLYDGEKIVAFANILTADAGKSTAIDLMRYTDDAPSGTMEFLFTALMLDLKHAGYVSFSLGMAPLSGMENRPGSDLWTRLGALLYQRGNRFYSFAGLRHFKAKFDPDWQPRYFVTRAITLPVVPVRDAAWLISGGGN